MRWLLVMLTVTLAACGQATVLQTPALAPTNPPLPGTSATADPYARSRKEMVMTQIEARDVSDRDVLEAMNAVPRHEFVPQEYLAQAYEDHPLPIGYGQTISQPYIVALMTEKLGIQRGSKVLEIGTGSGYQAAVLAYLGLEVYSVEIIPELARAADDRLKRLGYKVAVKQGDGYFGWEEHAPYDAIIVTAAPDHVPQPLAKQLKEGGRLVIPVGPRGSYQTLWQFTRQGDELKAVSLGGVAFVPLVSGK
jgi:protein-L-isoaspartate(D-aspartate) O-methyltransferase